MRLNPEAVQTIFFVFNDPKTPSRTEIYALTGDDLKRWMSLAKNSGFSALPPDTEAVMHPRMPVWSVPEKGDGEA